MSGCDPRFVVFDHDDDALLDLAREQGCSVITTDKTGNNKDIDAAQQLLRRTDWKVAFLHINPEPWKRIVSEAPYGRVIIRFSSEGFPPSSPIRNKAMCLFCNKRIDSLKPDDIDTLMAVLGDDVICENLGEGRIPKSIRHLISFEKPYHLQSLMILIQGILASIAADPGKSHSKLTRKCLGLSAIPAVPSQVNISKKIIRGALGLHNDCSVNEKNTDLKKTLTDILSTELCSENLNEYPKIASLVEAICSGGDDLDPRVAIVGYCALQEVLR